MDEKSSAEWDQQEQELRRQIERLQVRLISMRLRTLHDIVQAQQLLRESRAMVDESTKLIRRSRKLP